MVEIGKMSKSCKVFDEEKVVYVRVDQF